VPGQASVGPFNKNVLRNTALLVGDRKRDGVLSAKILTVVRVEFEFLISLEGREGVCVLVGLTGEIGCLGRPSSSKTETTRAWSSLASAGRPISTRASRVES